MPRYRCCPLDESGEVLRTEVLPSYELWEGSRRLAAFRPAAPNPGKT
jgi:hypothetical protein